MIRVLLVRTTVESDGRVDTNPYVRLAMERIDSVLGSTTLDKAIRNLEIDANRFWVLNESHWWKLSELLGISVENVKAALFRAPEGR